MGRRKRRGQSAKVPPEPTRPSRDRWVSRGLPLLAVAIVALVVYLAFVSNAQPAASTSTPTITRKARSLDQLLAMTPELLAQVDIAEMNLLCATGLPGAENLDIDKCLAKLDAWAARVKFETERHLYRLTDLRYADYAEHCKHSEARFRAEWLMAILQQDIGLHYYLGFVPQDMEVPPRKTSKEAFIHGLMDNNDPHMAFGGNCVSLPVAYAAVGRRLGYPVKLACGKEHVFCRWEGMGHPNPAWRDRFNFDGAGNGFSIDPDEFYLSWPRKTFPDQVELCDWLTSLSPRKELSLFMSDRGHVLDCVRQDHSGALVAYAHAARLWPESCQPMTWVANMNAKLYERQMAAHPEAFQQMVKRTGAANGNMGDTR